MKVQINEKFAFSIYRIGFSQIIIPVYSINDRLVNFINIKEYVYLMHIIMCVNPKT